MFSLIIHYLFELIHPYYDMNGRTGRLLTIWYAQKFNVSHHMMFFSEAINLFKKPLYYDAFDKSKEKDFKLDVNYFVASLSSALIAHKIITYILYELDNDLMSNKSVKLSSLQKIILQSLLAKDNKFYKARDFILGHDDYNKGQVSIALKQLEEYGLLKVVNSKPKEYQLIWTKTINKSFKYIADLAIGIK